MIRVYDAAAARAEQRPRRAAPPPPRQAVQTPRRAAPPPPRQAVQTPPTPDDAPLVPYPCPECAVLVSEAPHTLCPIVSHWRSYAWRLEDELDGQEGDLACVA